MKTILESERLILREFNLEDATNMYYLNLDKEVIQFTGDTSFNSLKDAESFLKNYTDYSKNGFGRWAVILKETNEFIGWSGLKLNEDNEIDIGFRFFKKHWNKGYATESAKACLQYGFTTLNLKTIIGRSASKNNASISVLEKIGMTYSKKGICHGIENAMYYAIDKQTYLKRNQMLNKIQLRELYGEPTGRAKIKVLNSLEKHSIHFINTSPFCVISTINSNDKMDASPRGGEKGFVKVIDNKTIAIPDFKGNNRIDSLINIAETNKIGLLFLIPGIDETLRINGSASISINEEYKQLFSKGNKLPISCIIISIEEVFLHCAKAFMRSKLWNIETQQNNNEFPSMGEMLKDQLQDPNKAESRKDMKQRYQKDL